MSVDIVQADPAKERVSEVVNFTGAQIGPGELVYILPTAVAGGPYSAHLLSMITEADADKSPIVGVVDGTTPVAPMARFDLIRFSSGVQVVGISESFSADEEVWYRPYEDTRWANEPGTLGNAVRLGVTHNALGTNSNTLLRLHTEWAAAVVWQGQPSPQISGSVIDNTILDSHNLTIVGRYIVPEADTVNEFIGEEGNYADWFGAYDETDPDAPLPTGFVFTAPTDGDKVIINGGPNVGQVWAYDAAGTPVKWTKSTETTSLTVSNYDVDKDVKAQHLVIKDAQLFQANDDIPSGTVFAIGNTGPTFEQIGKASARRNITTVTSATANGLAFIADGNLYMSRAIQGQGAWQAAEWSGGVFGSGRDGFANAYQIVFPNEPAGVTVADVWLCADNAFALMSNGRMYGWGGNSNGQLGIGNTTNQFLPVLINSQVKRMFRHTSVNNGSWTAQRTFIEKTDGTIWCTGYNGFGQLGLGDTTKRTSWTQVTALGNSVRNLWPLGGTYGCTFAQLNDGRVFVCGYNANGALGDTTTTQRNAFVQNQRWTGMSLTAEILQVEAGIQYDNNAGSNTGDGNVSILSKDGSTYRLLSSGTNSWGTINGVAGGVVTTPTAPGGALPSDIVRIARTGDAPGTMYAITSAGAVWSWGQNPEGQAARGNFISPAPVGLMTAGPVTNVWHTHSRRNRGYVVPSPIFEIAGAYWHSGPNGDGELGNGESVNANNLQKIRFPSGTVIKHFGSSNGNAADPASRLAVTSDNRVFAWGYNNGRQISYDQRTVYLPVEIAVGALFT